MMNALLTLRQVAERLNQSVKTVRRRIAERELSAVQLSNRAWRVEPEELERFITAKSITSRDTHVSKPLRFRANVSKG